MEQYATGARVCPVGQSLAPETSLLSHAGPVYFRRTPDCTWHSLYTKGLREVSGEYYRESCCRHPRCTSSFATIARTGSRSWICL